MADRRLEVGQTFAPSRDFEADGVRYRRGERLRLTDLKFSHYDEADIYYFEDVAGGIREWWFYTRENPDPFEWFAQA